MTSAALSIVIPAYDEQARIGRTIAATRVYLDERGGRGEVLVVDDGSRDRTAAIVGEEQRRDPRVGLLRHERNRGKGAAVRTGMLAARGERVLFMDADLATPLSELVKLEHALDGGADVAIGSRTLRGSRLLADGGRRPVREALGRAFNLLVRAVALGGYRDTQYGFKLFRREAARALFGAARIDGYAFDVEILCLARGRFRVAEVPVTWRHVERSRVSPVRDAPRMACDVLRLRLSTELDRLRPGRRPR